MGDNQAGANFQGAKPIKVGEAKSKGMMSGSQSGSTGQQSPQPSSGPKKKTSFQITSVTVGSSRLSNDGGDDSADDLDESHTDDISRITDNETPSFSEDTLSRDELVSNVIPTSAQYGLAILPEQVAGGNNVAAPVPVITPPISTNQQSNINSNQTGTVLHNNPVQNIENCVHKILEEFEIVNNGINGGSVAPNYINNSPSKINQSSHGGIITGSGVLSQSNPGVERDRPDTPNKESSMVTMSDQNAQNAPQQRSERFKVVKIESTEPFRRGRWMCMDYLDHSVNQPHYSPFFKPINDASCQVNGFANTGVQTQMTPPQTLPVPVIMQNGGTHQHPATINYQPVHQQSSPVSQPSPNPTVTSNSAIQYPSGAPQQPPTSTQPPQIYNQQNINSPITSQPPPTVSGPGPGQTYSGHPVTTTNCTTTTSSMPQAQTYAGQQIQHQFIQSGVLPPQPQPQTSVASSSSTSNSGCSSSSVLSNTSQTVSSTTADQHRWSDSSSNPTSTLTFSQPVSSTPIPFQQQIHHPALVMTAPNTIVTSTITATVPITAVGTDGASGTTTPAPISTTLTRTPSLNNIVITAQPNAVGTAGAPPQMLIVSLNSPTASLLEQQSHLVDPNLCANMRPISSTTTTTPADVVGSSTLSAAGIQPAPEDESASAASTVAIDNKIEQAMDLVKSHLMFAVREEVEVLKEKIAELMDRINQLEIENSILKSNATPEVLQQLPSPGTVMYGTVTTIATTIATASMKTSTSSSS